MISDDLDELSYPRLIASLLGIVGAWLLVLMGFLWLVHPG